LRVFFEGGLALWLIDARAPLANKMISFGQSQLGREGAVMELPLPMPRRGVVTVPPHLCDRCGLADEVALRVVDS
jgi:hypothetical protein